jgi:hypothetical protein
MVLVTIGFPGTSLFWAKFIFCATLVPFFLGAGVIVIILFFMLLPVVFMRVWVPI